MRVAQCCLYDGGLGSSRQGQAYAGHLTVHRHNDSVDVVIPAFDTDGLLPPGVYWANWDELVDRFGIGPWRRQLMVGLRAALDDLERAGCRVVYLNGSFVTSKCIPNDYDACWEEDGVDPMALHPALLTFDPGRATQKARYMGELFPA